MIRDDEPLARFLLSKRHYARTKGAIRPGAFLPPPDLRLSVFRTQGLELDEIWELGAREAAAPSDRTLYGSAHVVTSQVRAQYLDVEADEPPDRHANIIGWPADKNARTAIAQGLARDATLSLTGQREGLD